MGSQPQERRVKGPEDFLPSLSSPDERERESAAALAAGYAQALYDAQLIGAEEAAEYAALADAGERIARIRLRGAEEISRRLPFDNGARRLFDLLDKAAFYSAAEDVEVSDMLSALAQASAKGELARFKEEWLKGAGSR